MDRRTHLTTEGLLLVLLLAACGEQTSPGGSAADPATSAPTTSAPTNPPTGQWRTSIPAGIPLDAGLPQWGSEFTVVKVDDDDAPTVDWCGPVASPSAGVVDLAGWSATGPEYVEWRVLRLYESDVDAKQATIAVDAAVKACEKQTPDTLERRGSGLPLPGDETFTVVQTYGDGEHPTLGASIWVVLRRGNALLLTGTYGEWDPLSNLDEGVVQHEKASLTVAEAMCVFDSDPCPEVIPDDAALEDFPLDLGYPAPTDDDGFPRGRVLDVAFVNHLRFCGELGWDTEGEVRPTDYVGTSHSGASDVDASSFRTLARYRDPETAQKAMADLRAAVEACPEDERDEQLDKYSLIERDAGDEAFLVLHVSTYAGEVSSVELLDVVRVGDLLLLNDLMSHEQLGPEAITGTTDELAAEMGAFAGRSVE